MFIYFLVTCLPLTANYLLPKRKGEMYLISIILALFYCFGYMTGSDWRSYEYIFDNLENNYMSFIYFEPGFLLMLNFFKFLSIDFWVWFIILKLFCFYISIRFLHKLSPNNYFFSLFFYSASFAPFLFIDNPLRNLIASCIFFISYKYIISKEFYKFLGLIVVAVLFHSSAFFLFPLYFFSRIKLKSSSIVYVYIILNVVFILNVDFVKNLFILIGDYVPLLQGRVDSYFSGNSAYSDGRVFSIGNLIRIFFFILVIKYRSYIENKTSIVFFNFLIFYFIFYRLAISIEILGRLTLYFIPFYCIGMVLIMGAMSKEFKKIFSGTLILISLLTLYITITGSSKYIPYSNYLYFLNEDKPSFMQRSNYNIKESPYKNKDLNN